MGDWGAGWYNALKSAPSMGEGPKWSGWAGHDFYNSILGNAPPGYYAPTVAPFNPMQMAAMQMQLNNSLYGPAISPYAGGEMNLPDFTQRGQNPWAMGPPPQQQGAPRQQQPQQAPQPPPQGAPQPNPWATGTQRAGESPQTNQGDLPPAWTDNWNNAGAAAMFSPFANYSQLGQFADPRLANFFQGTPGIPLYSAPFHSMAETAQNTGSYFPINSDRKRAQGGMPEVKNAIDEYLRNQGK